jgi:DNA repair photolyase
VAEQVPLFPHGTGVAGLPVLHRRRGGTRFVGLPIRSILNPPEQTGLGFWSLNPYVGCEFGCSYCYARSTHRYVVERARAAGRLPVAEFADDGSVEGWESFERRVFVKQGADRVLARTLRPGRVSDRTIVIGTATDPYQPAERQFRLTRAVLQRLAAFEGLSVGLITKSPLVVRDVDVLRKIHERHRLTIHISLISTESRLIRLFEARSPMPPARLRALQRLVGAGLDAGLIVAPVLPGITDRLPHLDALMAAAKTAGARFIDPDPLRLYAQIRAMVLPLVDRHFPHLSARYRAAYARQGAAPKRYSRALIRRFRELERKYGFPLNDGMQDRYRT